MNFTVNDDDDDDNDDDDDDDGSDSYGDNFTWRKHFLLYLCHLMFLILTLGVLSFQAYTQCLSKVYERELKDFFEAAKQRTLTKGVRGKFLLWYV